MCIALCLDINSFDHYVLLCDNRSSHLAIDVPSCMKLMYTKIKFLKI